MISHGARQTSIGYNIGDIAAKYLFKGGMQYDGRTGEKDHPGFLQERGTCRE